MAGTRSNCVPNFSPVMYSVFHFSVTDSSTGERLFKNGGFSRRFTYGGFSARVGEFFFDGQLAVEFELRLGGHFEFRTQITAVSVGNKPSEPFIKAQQCRAKTLQEWMWHPCAGIGFGG